LYAREYNLKPPPVRPWHLNKRWSDSELQYMRDNREKATELYLKYYDDFRSKEHG
jgi:hypothetical protein